MEINIAYNRSIPKEMKSLYERAIKIIFGSCNIRWLKNHKIKITTKNHEISSLSIKK